MTCKINYGEFSLVIGTSGEYWVENEDSVTTLFDSDEESEDWWNTTAVYQW